jgi:hypothetical protein
MRTFSLPLLALGAALLTAGAAQATTVSGTGTFVDNGPAGNGLNFTGVTNNSLLTNLDLTAGTPVILTDFVTISTTDTTGSFFGTTEKDNIAENFSFTLPSSLSGSLAGSGSETVYTGFFGIVDGVSGKISWDNPLTLNFTDGAELQISLSDATFDKSGYFTNPNQSVTVNATLDLVQGPDPVPEPGTLLLFGASVIGLAAIMRRRQKAGLSAG